MTQSKTVETVLKWSIDPAGIQSTIAGNKKIQDTFTAIRAQADKEYVVRIAQIEAEKTKTASAMAAIRAAADDAYTRRVADLSAAQQQTTQTVSAIQRQQTEVQDLTDLYEGLAQQEKAAGDAAETAATKSANTGLSLKGAQQFASRATSVASATGIGGQAFSGIAGVLGLVDQFGAAAALAVPFSLALKAVAAQEEAAAEKAKEFVGQLEEIAGLVSGGSTSDEIKKNIDQQQRALEVYQASTTALQGYSDRVNSINDDYNQGKIGVDEYQKKFRDLADEVSKATNGKIDFTGLTDNFAGDLQRRLGGAIAGIQPDIDKIKDRIAAYNVALKTPGIAANDAAADLKVAADAIEAFKEKVQAAFKDGLPKITDEIIQGLKDAAKKAAENIATALSSQTDAYFTSLTNGGAAQDARTKAAQQISDYWTASGQAASKIQQAESAKEIEIRTKSAAALGDKIAAIERTSAERILDQRENLNLDVQGLVARGDIAAGQAAIARQRLSEQQAARQDKDAKDEARTAAQKQADEQIAQAQASAKQQLDAQRDKDSQQLKQLNATLTKAKADETAAQAAALSIARNGQQQRQIQEYSHQTILTNLAYSAGNVFKTVAQNVGQYLSDLASRAASVTGGHGGGGVSGGGGGGTPRPGEVVGLPAVTGTAANFPGSGRSIGTFDTPSYNTQPGIYRAMVPEAHIPFADFNRMNMGSTVNHVTVNVDAKNSNMSPSERQRWKEEIKTETVQALAAVHARVNKKGA